MAIKEGIRPGGRSARVQQSVHGAVRELLEQGDRASLTVPLIAARAGVTPSTIYRRWGELSALLADVNLSYMRPDTPPVDTGSLRGDLSAWAEQYLDEMNSSPGREMIRDFISSGCSAQCAQVLRGQLQLLLDRAQARREEGLPSADHLLDQIVAPVLYRLLFCETPASLEQMQEWVDRSLAS